MQQAELSDMCREKDLEPTAEYWERRGQVSKGHLLFRTKSNKLLENGTKSAQMGNEVCVLWGGRMPLLLRRVGCDGSYRLVGEFSSSL